MATIPAPAPRITVRTAPRPVPAWTPTDAPASSPEPADAVPFADVHPDATPAHKATNAAAVIGSLAAVVGLITLTTAGLGGLVLIAAELVTNR